MQNPATTRVPAFARRRALPLLVLLPVLWSQGAVALPVQVSVDRLTVGDSVIANVEIDTDTLGTSLRLEAGRVELPAGWRVEGLEFDCSAAGWGGDSPCAGAGWSLSLAPPGATAGEASVRVSGLLDTVELTGEVWKIGTRIESDPLVGTLTVQRTGGELTGRLDWQDQPLVGLEALPLPPSPLDWLFEGIATGSVDFAVPQEGPLRVDYQVKAREMSFDSPEGVYAASQLSVEVTGSATVADAIDFDAAADIDGGELLIDRFYAAFDDTPLHLEVDAVKRGDGLRLQSVRVGDGKALEIVGTAELNLESPVESLDYTVDRLELQFPLAYERYLESMLGPLTLDGLAVTGSVLWQGSGQAGAYPEGELQVNDLSIVDRQRERFAVTGLDARIHVGAGPGDSRIAWRGLLFRKINLGAGEASIATSPGVFELAEPLRLDVLGGALVVQQAAVLLPPDDAPADAEPEVNVEASLDGLEIARLTEALGWPRFEGEISGTIPGVSLEGGVLEVDGEIQIDVFDGRMRLYGLRVERLFGVLPSLAGNLEVENFDLERLTQTFSFGRISGRLDGHVRELRMLDWEPVAFDAWFGTPLNQKADQDISRRAVNHLTTIAGGGPTAALTGPLMGLFSNFSYQRLGIGCVLENYVCRLRGLEDSEEGVLILEGAGIPHITIRAYNRRMDFPQLVANLQAAAEGEGVRIGEKPSDGS